MPEDAFPTIAALDALLAESYAPQPALAALEPPAEDVLPGPVSGEPSWVEAVREDWALG
jgi:hypothetical protein